MKRFLSVLLSVCLLSGGMASVVTAAVPGRFSDITDPETQRAAELLNNLGIIEGDGANKYNPNGTFTRAMLAVLAVKLSGIDDVSSYAGTVRFPDVRAGYWAHPWIMAAVQLGIVTGGSSGNYEPAAPMRYSYLTTVLMRLLGYKDEDVGLNWPQSYISKAEALGLSKGMKFSQNDVLTRGQVARLVYNFLYMSSKEGKVYIEEHFQTSSVTDIILSFEIINGESVITHEQKSYTYRGALDASLKGRLASLLVDGEGNVLTIAPDETATYKTVGIREKRVNGLTLTDGSSLPIPTLGVCEWDGVLTTYDKATFWENEPVTLVYRDGILLYILRDSRENQIGAQFIKTLLRIATTANGQTFVLAEDGAEYPVSGTIDPALSGRTGNLMIDREGYAISFTVSEDYTYQPITVSSVQNNGFSGAEGNFISVSEAMTVWSDVKNTYDNVWETINPGDVLLVAYDAYGRIAYIYRSLTRGSGAYALAILSSQPRNGVRALTELFGPAAENAVLYKNGYRADPDMLDKWDVLQYYESAGIIEASSVRLAGQYTDPTPNPTTPTKIKLMGKDFDLLPEATQKMAANPAGQRCAFLLTANGLIADVRPLADVPDITLGLADGNTVTVNETMRFTGDLIGFESLYQGKLCSFSGSIDGISVTPINIGSTVLGRLDLTAMKLGNAPIAPWCAFFDQVGLDGQGAFITVDDITATLVNSENILYARYSPSGYVTTIILNNMTGDAYKYGYAKIGSVTESVGEGGEIVHTTVTVDNGLSAITPTLYADDNKVERIGTRTIVGVAQGFLANGTPKLLDMMICTQYKNITRFDFDGDRFVTLNGTKVRIADELQVFIPSAGEYMTLTAARAYCKSFEVFTDPWGYKVRFITGQV